MTTPTDLSDQAIAQEFIARALIEFLPQANDVLWVDVQRWIQQRARELQAQQPQQGGGECAECGGSGQVEVQYTVAKCCGHQRENGDCCGDPVPDLAVNYEPCSSCPGATHAPPSRGEDDVEFWAERLEMLSEVHGCGSGTMKTCASLIRRLSNAGGVVDDAMVERAAIALQTINDCSSTPWHDLPDYGKDRLRDQARAALCAALGVER